MINTTDARDSKKFHLKCAPYSHIYSAHSFFFPGSNQKFIQEMNKRVVLVQT